MKKFLKIIIIIIISLIVILLLIKITSNLIYKYTYEPCMKYKPSPIYENETGTWTNGCPEGCTIDSCFGIKTACCPY